MTAKSTKHTTIHIEDLDFSGDIIINDVEDDYFCMADTQEKAEFMVRAVNSYAEMIDALEYAYDWFTEYEPQNNSCVELIGNALIKAKGE